MATFIDFLTNTEEKLVKAQHLSDIESKNDPDNEPFKSKYAAREIWTDLLSAIGEDKCTDNPSNNKWIVLSANLQFKLGVNYIECEELSTGEEHLDKCKKQLEPLQMSKEACSLYIDSLVQLGCLWCQRRQFQSALDYLKQAESLYKKYMHEVGGSPHCSDEIFRLNAFEDGELTQTRHDKFEDVYTHTLYYLAQVYSKLDEPRLGAEFCHLTLQRQLSSSKHDALDWSLNAATLAQYYITDSNFHMARHCMASASVKMQEVEVPTDIPPPSDEETQAEMDRREKIPRAHADLARCWTKYGLALLEHSWEQLVESLTDEDGAAINEVADHNSDKSSAANHNEDTQEPDTESSDAGGEGADAVSEKEESKSNSYFKLELTSYEDYITDKNLLDFEQARGVFLAVQKWINESKEFYLLDGQCSDHVEIIQDHSKLFKLLANFDPDFERQCKMHKRRADMLEGILKELSTQFYMMVCRQLMFELAETYSGMVDLKLAIVESQGIRGGSRGGTSPHAAGKINQLTDKSIKKFEEYISTLRVPDKTKDGKKSLPTKFASDDERPALIAHFCTGRLYSKFINSDKGKRLENMDNSLQYYSFLVNYVKLNPDAEKCVKSEYEVCAELVELLPLKIDRIRVGALVG